MVYLPIDALYLALVTAKDSNIIEDISTLSAVKEVVHAVLAPSVREESIAERYCDLVFAFDEMISLGQRTVFSRSQISALLAMESTNEKLQSAILLGKEKEARKRAQEELRLTERRRRSLRGAEKEDNLDVRMPRRSPSPPSSPQTLKESPRPALGRGLQLRRAKVTERRPAASPEPLPAFNPLAEEIDALLEERLSGEISATGEWRNLELKGALLLTVRNPRLERWSLQFEDLRLPPGAAAKVPPSYDKAAWAKGLLTLREGAAAPTPDVPVECLKYSLSLPAGDARMPFQLTTWFNERETSFEIDFNSAQSLFPGLDHLAVEFALPDRVGARVTDYAGSEVQVEKRGFKWVLAPLNAENPAASVVLSTRQALSPDEVFPVEMSLESARTVLDFSRATFLGADDRPLLANFRRSLVAHGLFIR